MRVCRFSKKDDDSPRIGVVNGDNQIIDLSPHGIQSLVPLFDASRRSSLQAEIDASAGNALSMEDVCLLAPVDNQEVWAAGVTYFRSREARMEESESSGGDVFYDQISALHKSVRGSDPDLCSAEI